MSSSAKKQKNVDLPKLPKISDSVEEPIVQTLATVCAKLYDEALNAAWKPTDGSEPDKFLAQPYKLSKEGGQYKEGGEYTADGYTEGEGDLVSGYHVFNKDTTVKGKTCGYASLASYGTVIDGFTDFHGMNQAAIPPFAALVVQPNDETEVRARSSRSPLPPFLASQLRENAARLWQAPILILAWRGSVTVLDWINDVAFSPTLCRPPPHCARRQSTPTLALLLGLTLGLTLGLSLGLTLGLALGLDLGLTLGLTLGL